MYYKCDTMKKDQIIHLRVTKEEVNQLNELSQLLEKPKSEILRSAIKHPIVYYRSLKNKDLTNARIKDLMTLYFFRKTSETFIDLDIRTFLDLFIKDQELKYINKIPDFKKLEKLNKFESILKNCMPLCNVKISELKKIVKTKYGVDEAIFKELLKELWKIGKCILEEGDDKEGINFEGKNYCYVKFR